MHSNKPKVYVIVPLTIPGVNKTDFFDVFQRIVEEKDLGYIMISLRLIRAKIARNTASNKLREGNSTERNNKFINSKAKKEFKKQLETIMLEAGRTQHKAHFICVDKHHPPRAVPKILRLVKEVQKNSCDLDVALIALVPTQRDLGITYDLDGRKRYHPFSANLFFTCFDRVQKRQDHETLNGEGPGSAEVIVRFLWYFRNFSLNKNHLAKRGFKKVFYVPFVEENDHLEIPRRLLETLITTLKSCNHKGSAQQSDLDRLNTLYEELQLPFKGPELEDVEAAITRFLEEDIYPDVFPVEERKKELKPKEAPEKIKYLRIVPAKDSVEALKEFAFPSGTGSRNHIPN